MPSPLHHPQNPERPRPRLTRLIAADHFIVRGFVANVAHRHIVERFRQAIHIADDATDKSHGSVAVDVGVRVGVNVKVGVWVNVGVGEGSSTRP